MFFNAIIKVGELDYMKRLKRILSLVAISLLLTNCGKEKLELNKQVTLTGTVTVKEIKKDDTTTKVSILNLDEPVIIDGDTIHKIELDSDKEIKNNSEITITGTLKSNSDSAIDLDYSFEVLEVDDILSYINTFTNEDFSMTIPAEIIKLCTVKQIDNGFVVYSTSNLEMGGEVFRIISVTNEEFKVLNKNENKYIEKITSTKEKTIIIQYPNENVEEYKNFKDYETIVKKITTIKDNVRLK